MCIRDRLLGQAQGHIGLGGLAVLQIRLAETPARFMCFGACGIVLRDGGIKAAGGFVVAVFVQPARFGQAFAGKWEWRRCVRR